ncbi:hypothetical protein DB32_006450 [Sandaracinus amylolyticus]|uniref:Uncharacterized protein n=1 Tax=Sandaracinus amylolyticus TaxID=927083 RepID=A0A0F6YMI1_9BACT|nr:hypothetical protein DB32_006450 [Sandaracinus amylolyticus]
MHHLDRDQAREARSPGTAREIERRHSARPEVGEDRVAPDDVADLEHDGCRCGGKGYGRSRRGINRWSGEQERGCISRESRRGRNTTPERCYGIRSATNCVAIASFSPRVPALS